MIHDSMIHDSLFMIHLILSIYMIDIFKNNKTKTNIKPNTNPKTRTKKIQKRGRVKSVYYNSNATNVYVSSTKTQMKKNQITRGHLIEEFKLTNIEHELFPELILSAFEVETNDPKIKKRYNKNNIEIYTYKKHRVDDIGNKHIIDFIIKSIETFAHSRDVFFVNLDIKDNNIGIFNKKLIYLDNGPKLFYPVPLKFLNYFKNVSLIVALCNLKYKLTKKELKQIKKRISYDEMIHTFNVRLSNTDVIEIKKHVYDFFMSHDLPLTAELEILMPSDVLKYYCISDDIHNDTIGHFRQISKKIGLDKL